MNILDKVLEQCQKLGIMVIIDLHRVPGGKEFNHGVVQEEAKLYDNPEFAEEFVESWRKLARRYRDCPVVYAYDLINEPNQKTPRRIDYLELQYRAAKAIREIDPETPICVTSNDWSSPRYFSYLHPLPLKNIIYNVHMYRPLTYTHQRVVPALTRIYTYPGNVDGKYWDKDALRRCLAPVREFQQKYGARIVMSEFSLGARRRTVSGRPVGVSRGISMGLVLSLFSGMGRLGFGIRQSIQRYFLQRPEQSAVKVDSGSVGEKPAARPCRRQLEAAGCAASRD